VGQLDGWTCADILDKFSLTIAQFFKYNPDVNNDCSGLWLGYRYCVRDNQYVSPSSATTGTTPTPTPSGPPGPVQPGQPQNCNKWHVAVGTFCIHIYTISNILTLTFTLSRCSKRRQLRDHHHRILYHPRAIPHLEPCSQLRLFQWLLGRLRLLCRHD